MAQMILFDKLAFIGRLKRAGIEDNQARAHGEAMEDALRESVATKSDIARLESMTRSDILRLENIIHSEITRPRNQD
jgi:hypothetical protein